MKTSRSKIVTWFECPRKRYWLYHFGGKGIQKITVKGPTQTGLAIHKANSLILQIGSIGRVLEQVLGEYEQTFPFGIPFRDELLKEHLTFIEGVVRAFHRCRFPKLIEEGKIIAIEQEHVIPLGEGLDFQFRADAIKETEEGIIIIDFKPTSFANYQFIKKYERNHQTTSYCWAAEQIYSKRCLGIQIEGYVKGKRQAHKDLFNGEVKVQNSPLCYVYVNEVTGQISPEYQRSAGWKKTPLWETSLTPKEYIEDFLTFEEVENLFLAPIPPIAPNLTQLESWKTQTISNELRIQKGANLVERMRESGNEGLFLKILDEQFPQNMDSCYKFGEDYPCECENVCFNSEVAQNVLESGLYEERISHHEDFESD